MEERQGVVTRHLVRILSAAVPGIGVSLWLSRSVPQLSPYLSSVLVFLAAKVGGDVASFILYPQPLVIYEDFIRDMFVFAGLGLLAAGAGRLAASVIGGGVHPVIPAIGAYVAYTLQESRP